jgi:hypothetical protein
MTEQRSAEILDALNGFADQWDRFTDHLEKVGDRIGSAQKAFDTVNGVRRRQLERQLDRVDDLHRDERAAAVLALAPGTGNGVGPDEVRDITSGGSSDDASDGADGPAGHDAGDSVAS